MDEQLERLTDRLFDLVVSQDVAATRGPGGVVLTGTDITVAVTAVWDNPSTPPPGQSRTFGVKMGFVSEALFGGIAYEYSYGTGLDDDEAAKAALERWVVFDLPVLVEAFAGNATQCTLMELAAEPGSDIAAGQWKIYMGPLNYYADQQGAQPCCQACVLTMALPSLVPLIATPVSFAVKIVVSKSDDGETSADVRRNGEDVPEAIRAVAEVAREWPDMPGVQMRRQYFYVRAPT